MKYLLAVILNPTIWIRNSPTNSVWSRRVERLIENKAKIVYKDEYTVKFEDGTYIWISNKMYAYGSNYNDYGYLPSRVVALKLLDYLASIL